ncbi:MAG: RecQ family zinc-binding domain-containing protein, partial [Rhodoblastus sp.]|nr:RecQ family zinc-binding domain-containing protein [Rhodoblastus sp.]
GRDGLPAEATAFVSRPAWTAHGARDMDISQDARADELAAIGDFARGFDCRWRVVLAYLGEAANACGACDNCRRHRLWLRGPHRLARSACDALVGRVARLFDAQTIPAETDADPPAAEAVSVLVDASDDTALTVAQARRLARLKAARMRIARRTRVAPAQIADETALTALARLDPSELAPRAREVVDTNDAAVLDLLKALARDELREL